MRALSVSLVLGSLLTLSQAGVVPHPDKDNSTGLMRYSGRCYYETKWPHSIGSFVPKCDDYGDFLPQQCWASTGYCWCVNTITGKEIPNTKTPSWITPIDCSSGYYCPYNWARYGQQCFGFMDSMKTWTAAEAYCLFEGANLASVHSDEENIFLQHLTRAETHDFPMTWIGGHDAIYMSIWMWTDGSKFDYENWATNYRPNKEENCLKMNYGYQKKWINCHCNYTMPFICAKTIMMV